MGGDDALPLETQTAGKTKRNTFRTLTIIDSLEPLSRLRQVGMAVYFTLFYLLHFYLSDHRFQYVFSMASYVDILTIVPVLFDLVGVGGANLGFLRVVRVMRVLRILRMRRLIKVGENEVQRQVPALSYATHPIPPRLRASFGPSSCALWGSDRRS